MEGRKLATEFANLKLPNLQPHNPSNPQGNTDRIFRFRATSGAPNMDSLGADFNTALEETADTNSSNRSTTSKRKFGKSWKRRCKSTSNLVVAGQNLSEDSSSSVDTRGRGTSSLQFSDSDIEVSMPGLSRGAHGRSRQNRHDYRGIRTHQAQMGESDSFNENISPFKEFRTTHSSKRRRKMKRMAVDHSPENRKPKLAIGKLSRSGSGPTVSVKRKKVRTKSGGEVMKSSKMSVGSVSRRPGVLPLGGKRKRSHREKSVESGDMLSSGRSRTASLGDTQETHTGSQDTMDCDEVCSSSSLSSSEWENLSSDCSPEADDEQSDWPGPEPNQGQQGERANNVHLTDEEGDREVRLVKLSLAGPRGSQSRVIRSGTRRLKNRHRVSPSSVGPGVSLEGEGPRESLLQFLADRRKLSLKLPVLNNQDRNFLLNLASIYQLSWRPDGPSLLVLSKTCATLSQVETLGCALPGAQDTSFALPHSQPPGHPLNLTFPLTSPPSQSVNISQPSTQEFAVPGAPAVRTRGGAEHSRLRERKSTDIKRQRRTPPLPAVYTASQGPRQERQHSGRHKTSKTLTLSGSKSN